MVSRPTKPQASDDNLYSRHEFVKAVNHSIGANSSHLRSDATDSDSDSPDDDQASADAGTATVNPNNANANAMDDCEVCLVAQREPRLALVPCGRQRFCESRIRHSEVLAVFALSAERISRCCYVCFDTCNSWQKCGRVWSC